MLLVLSGEGPTDMGSCASPIADCVDPDFQPGPMALLADQALASLLGYSVLRDTPMSVHFISEAALADETRRLKEQPRKMVFPGKKTTRETGYFYKNAWAMGLLSMAIEKREKDTGISVLFRDSDGTRSTRSGLWGKKWESMERGFIRSGYPRGVPMLPNPKSEAWLLCAAKNPPYQDCVALEALSGNDHSPNAAKKKLDAAFGGHRSAEELCDWLDANPFDAGQAQTMPSFRAFHARMREAFALL